MAYIRNGLWYGESNVILSIWTAQQGFPCTEQYTAMGEKGIGRVCVYVCFDGGGGHVINAPYDLGSCLCCQLTCLNLKSLRILFSLSEKNYDSLCV